MDPKRSAFAASRIALVAVLALALVYVGCDKADVAPTPSAQQSPPVIPAAGPEGYAAVTASQLAGMLPTKDFTMINVHTPYEGEIPRTDFNIPFDQIAENLEKLPAKDAPILIYCRSGRMSTEATLTLVRLGYSHLMHLEGGFNAWKAAGNQMIKEP